MPSEALQRPARQPVRAAISTTPPRLRLKGPVGPDFPRQPQAAAERPKQSAVERLEADKAKYVKSQVALSKQLPASAPAGRKPPPQLNQHTALRPTRRSPAPLKARRERAELNLLNSLTNLISDVNDGPQQPNASAESQQRDAGAPAEGAPAKEQQQQQEEEEEKKEEKKPRPPPPPPRPDWSSPAKVRLKASRPARAEPPASPVSPTARTVRRVDVMPPAGTPRRAPVSIRQPLHPVWLQQPHFPLRQAATRFHLQHPSKTAGAPPLKPITALRKAAVSAGAETPGAPPPAAPPPPPPPAPLPLFPPPSPARTHLSSSSRKRPSLTRSKSDLSDRCSRVGTELERFFNLCGLDPADLQEWAGSCSDIVSMARFRSVSAPGSECAASERRVGEEEEEEEEEEGGNQTARVPYGLSVIERNARVIKWLYGLRNAKDGANKSTDL